MTVKPGHRRPITLVESKLPMDKTLAKDKPVDIPASSDNNPTALNRVLSAICQVISTDGSEADQPTPSGPNQTDRSTRLIRLKRTAENLEQVEQSLIRQIGIAHTTDRATDKLICQLQIQTNRLLVQLGELIDE